MAAKDTHDAAGWLVYFNGVEVPVTSCRVSARVGSIPQATIAVPPDNLMKRIGAQDRVRVTVFYYDSYYPETQDEDPTWNLLFEGEIVDYRYSNSASGRNIEYTAVDMISVLTKMFPTFVTNIASVVDANTQKSRNSTAVTLNPVAQTYTLFNIGLADGELIRRPYDFVLNVFRLLLGEGAEETAQSVVSKQWFERWVTRTQIVRRILPSIKPKQVSGTEDTAGFPILEAAQKGKAIESLAKEGDRVANNSSYYQLIRLVFQRVYYELSPVLAPPAITVDRDTRYTIGAPEDLSDNTYGILALGQHITQPKNLFGLPPMCNVIWPSMVENHQYSENYATQPTRTYLGNPYKFQQKAETATQQRIIDHAMTQGYPEEAQQVLNNRKKSGEAKTNIDNFLVYPEEFFKGPTYQRLNAPAWFQFLNTEDEDANNQRLHKFYTAMEHHRARLAKRNGGVSLVFNPYIVVAQPCAVIDEIESNNHVFGYVTSVSHRLSQNGMSTQVQYSHAQVFDEFFENLVTLRAEYDTGKMSAVNEEGEQITNNTDVLFAPIHPIKYNREKFQRYLDANAHFSDMFYHGKDVEAVFDWRKYIGINREMTQQTSGPKAPESGDNIEEIKITIDDSNAVEQDGIVPVFDVFDKYRIYMEDTREALKLASRPVCSVEEFIQFQEFFGVRQGRRLPTNPREGKIAPYYVKILSFIQGPGVEPGETTTGDRCTILEVDTIRNWERRFLEFRRKVYYTDYPHKG